MIFLDHKNQLVLDKVIGRGTVDHPPVYPREIIDVLSPFDISVHDHLIVDTAGVVSFRSAGLI